MLELRSRITQVVSFVQKAKSQSLLKSLNPLILPNLQVGVQRGLCLRGTISMVFE